MSAWGGHQVLGGSGSAWGSPGWSLPSSARSRAGVLGTCLAQRLHPLPRPGVTPGSVPVQAGASECETGRRGQVAVPQPGRLRAAGTGLWGRGLLSRRAHYSSASPRDKWLHGAQGPAGEDSGQGPACVARSAVGDLRRLGPDRPAGRERHPGHSGLPSHMNGQQTQGIPKGSPCPLSSYRR